MGSPVSPALKEVSEAASALVVIAESLAPKLADGALSPEEAVQAWEEVAPGVEKAVEGLSLSVAAEAFKEDPEGLVELGLASAAKAVGVLVGKPVVAPEKSDAVEVVEAVGSVALSFVNAVPGRSVLAAGLVSLVVNRSKIRAAVDGRTEIAAQFAANPFGQGLAVASSVLGYVKALRGAAFALQAAG